MRLVRSLILYEKKLIVPTVFAQDLRESELTMREHWEAAGISKRHGQASRLRRIKLARTFRDTRYSLERGS